MPGPEAASIGPATASYKEGMLVRGHGRVLGSQKGFAAISIEQDRTTVWQGAEAKTVES